MSGGHRIPVKDGYTKEDFLEVLLPNKPRSVALIMGEIGCAKNTAKKYLRELEAAGLAEKMHIEGSTFGWVAVDPIKTIDVEGVVNENGLLYVDKRYAGMPVKLRIIENKNE